jgi:hypothetical protein
MDINSDLVNFINNVSIGSCLVPLTISIVNNKYIGKTLTSLFILFIVSLFTEILNKIHMDMGLNNSYLFHFFTILEFILVSVFYSRFFKQYFNPFIINILILFFLVIAYLDYQVNGLNSIDNFSISIESIILTFYSLYLFYYILKNLLFEDLLSEPVFWINTGILVYFAGNLLIFVFSNYLIQNAPKTHLLLWTVIHSFINIFYNILLSVGFWKTRAR